MRRYRFVLYGSLSIPLFLLLLVTKSEIFNEHTIIDYRPSDGFASLTEKQRAIVKEELHDYNFPPNTKLENFSFPNGGKPLRNVIIASWRTGSTFLGEIVASVPGDFHYFEPLMQYGQYEVGKPTVKQVKKMLHCDYTEMNDYMEFAKTHLALFSHNPRLWSECTIHPKYCFNPEFLRAICVAFPFISMKIVRWRLKLAEELLTDEKLDVRVLKLIRDPRAIVSSRKHKINIWCTLDTDCADVNKLCSGMIQDYATASKFQRLYPERFKVVRFEDLTMDPYQHTGEILKFFRLDYHSRVVEFLNSHTKIETHDDRSTFKKTATVPFRWMRELDLDEIRKIEKTCEEALKIWGYLNVPANPNASHFYPLTTYRIV